ncbi:MAG: hypothetical protein QM207_01995, partial [Thermobispora sp.]|nr:hypothetical protein [Thermobispora sp.]
CVSRDRPATACDGNAPASREAAGCGNADLLTGRRTEAESPCPGKPLEAWSRCETAGTPERRSTAATTGATDI